MNLIVTVNGPGEAAGWLRPLADAFARDAPDVSITAVVTPCQFASGREPAVVAQFSGVSHVERLTPFLRRASVSRLIGTTATHSRLVLHLGGEPVYALLLARALSTAAWTYGTSARYRRLFGRFLVPDERTGHKLRARAVAEDRISVVGQLVTDSVQARHTARSVASHEPTVVFLAGSRDAHVDFMVPYYAAVADDLHTRGGVRSVLLASPFVAFDRFRSRLSEAGWTITSRGVILEATSPRGATICLVRGGVEDLAGADLAVTIPGTNTLQLAALGIPHLVVIPCQRAELIAFGGALGFLKSTWWGAAYIRRAALKRMGRRLPYLAIPNIIAGDRVVPELRGEVYPAEVADQVTALVASADARRAMSVRLKAIAGAPGAAGRIVALIRMWERGLCESAS